MKLTAKYLKQLINEVLLEFRDTSKNPEELDIDFGDDVAQPQAQPQQDSGLTSQGFEAYLRSLKPPAPNMEAAQQELYKSMSQPMR